MTVSFVYGAFAAYDVPKAGCHGIGNVPCKIKKRGSDRSFAPKTLSKDEQIAKIGPVDPEIIGLQKERN